MNLIFNHKFRLLIADTLKIYLYIVEDIFNKCRNFMADLLEEGGT